MATGNIEDNIPNTPNTVGDSWQPLVEQHIISRQGDNHISLTEWSSSSTVPQVSSGSSIEVNGSLITYSSNTPLVNDTGLASGTVYLLIDISDAINAYPTLVNDVPVWNAAKNGFYRGANERYTGHRMTWDGSASYTAKATFPDKDIGLEFIYYVDGSLSITGEITSTELDINGNGDISGDLVVQDGITANSINTDNTALKIKKFTGTTITTASANFTHGLDYTKIVSLTVSCNWDGTTNYYTSGSDVLEFMYYSSTNIRFQFVQNGKFGTKPYIVIATYEA